ncbi:MAG: hypothetical protein CL693_00160 [Cellvibrionaceae bacterium]|nr:hypothetical protein [Cellvibrionaceae bacterium]|tara:strand:- start:778 stop:1650 length:873 start_codon:yes stop_codon:yes gene_type:complete
MFTDKEKKDLQQRIQSNKHEVYVVSFEEMDAIIKSSPKGNKPSVQAAWQKIKGKVGVSASYYASADDAVTMAKLIGDLGGIGARAYIKNYGGKPHIILKGHAGLRTVLTGTKYGIKNPKVVSMGLGKTGAISAARQGGILTVVLLSAYRVADYFLTDQATLNQLIGTLATDVVKVGIATAASIGAAVVMGGFTLAVGPILAVVAVGFGVSMLLEYADNSLGVTSRVISGLDELGENASNYIADQKRRALDSTGRAVNQIVDHAIESARSITINWVRSTLREYLSPSRKVW